MAKKGNSISSENRKAQMEMQNKEIKETLRHIKNKILVMSGKGGVGKSSVAAYLSVSLAKKGYRVGLMDVDLHGPSIPRILGLKGDLGFSGHEKKMLPVKYLPNMEIVKLTDPKTSSWGHSDKTMLEEKPENDFCRSV